MKLFASGERSGLGLGVPGPPFVIANCRWGVKSCGGFITGPLDWAGIFPVRPWFRPGPLALNCARAASTGLSGIAPLSDPAPLLGPFKSCWRASSTGLATDCAHQIVVLNPLQFIRDG